MGYTSNIDKYSIQYPSWWSVEEHIWADIMNPDETVFISVSVFPKENRGLDEEVVWGINRHKEHSFYYKLISNKRTTYQGFEAREIEAVYQTLEMIPSYRQKSLIILAGASYYEVSIRAPQWVYSSYSLVFDCALSSFHILD